MPSSRSGVIEPTADMFREISGEALMEHHGTLDPERQDDPSQPPARTGTPR